MNLYEVVVNTRDGDEYDELWLAESHLDAARRSVAYAREQNILIASVSVSTMRQPEDPSKGGLVYVVNDTRLYEVRDGRVANAGRLARP